MFGHIDNDYFVPGKLSVPLLYIMWWSFWPHLKSKHIAWHWLLFLFQVPGTVVWDSLNPKMLVLDTVMVNERKGKCIWFHVSSIQRVVVTRRRFLKLCLGSTGKIDNLPSTEAAWWRPSTVLTLILGIRGQRIWNQRWSGQSEILGHQFFMLCEYNCGDTRGTEKHRVCIYKADKLVSLRNLVALLTEYVRVQVVKLNMESGWKGWVEELWSSLFLFSRNFFNTDWRIPRKANHRTKIPDTFKLFFVCLFASDVYTIRTDRYFWLLIII